MLMKAQSDPVCSICHLGENEGSHGLLKAPCSCTMIAHSQCLMSWYASQKAIINEGQTISIDRSKLTCLICRKQISIKVRTSLVAQLSRVGRWVRKVCSDVAFVSLSGALFSVVAATYAVASIYAVFGKAESEPILESLWPIVEALKGALIPSTDASLASRLGPLLSTVFWNTNFLASLISVPVTLVVSRGSFFHRFREFTLSPLLYSLGIHTTIQLGLSDYHGDLSLSTFHFLPRSPAFWISVLPYLRAVYNRIPIQNAIRRFGIRENQQIRKMKEAGMAKEKFFHNKDVRCENADYYVFFARLRGVEKHEGGTMSYNAVFLDGDSSEVRMAKIVSQYIRDPILELARNFTPKVISGGIPVRYFLSSLFLPFLGAIAGSCLKSLLPSGWALDPAVSFFSQKGNLVESMLYFFSGLALDQFLFNRHLVADPSTLLFFRISSLLFPGERAFLTSTFSGSGYVKVMLQQQWSRSLIASFLCVAAYDLARAVAERMTPYDEGIVVIENATDTMAELPVQKVQTAPRPTFAEAAKAGIQAAGDGDEGISAPVQRPEPAAATTSHSAGLMEASGKAIVSFLSGANALLPSY